ncbi:VOC family protein [Streptomyces coelicoflavus]
MLSFYMKSPSGIGVEYGTEGKLIDDDTWTVTNWNAAAFWGHDRSHTH